MSNILDRIVDGYTFLRQWPIRELRPKGNDCMNIWIRRTLLLLILIISVAAVYLSSATTSKEEILGSIEQHLKGNRPEEALAVAQNAVETFADNKDFNALYSIALERCNQIEHAEMIARDVIENKAEHPEAHFALAEIEDGRSNWESVVDHAGKAVASKRFGGEAQLLLASSYVNQNELEKAVENFTSALDRVDYFTGERISNIKSILEFSKTIRETDLYSIDNSFSSTSLSSRVRYTKVFVPVTVNGNTAGEFVIDTGNSGMVSLTEEFAKKLGIKNYGSLQVRGADGKFTMWISIVDSLKIGDLVVRNVPVAVSKSKAIAVNLQGNIGRLLLHRFNVSIDYQNKKVHIFSKERKADQLALINDESISTRTPINYRQMLLINVRVNEQGSTPFILDTGAHKTLLRKVFVDDYLRHTIRITPDSRVKIRGARGKAIPATLMNLSSLEFGGARFEEVEAISVDLAQTFANSNQLISGIIGADLFQKSRLHFNFADSELIVEDMSRR